MWVEKVEKVLPCISDPWKLRGNVYPNSRPGLTVLARYLEGRYSQRLGVVMIRSGRIDLSFYADGKVTVREVEDVVEAETWGLPAEFCGTQKGDVRRILNCYR